jgi:hypothetical protein
MRAPITGAVLAGLLTTVVARALPFTVPVDPNQSALTFELCVSGRCDTETSPVTGSVVVALDCVDAPTEIWLHDFHVYVQNTLTFNLSWGFLGTFTATGNALSLYYAEPGVALGPTAITGGGFVFGGVPARKTGNLVYHATGVPCLALQNVGRPCDDTRDLAGEPASNSDWNGSVTTLNRAVTVVTTVDTTTALDPNNPGLGSLHVSGTVRGTVYVARPTGDVDGDGDVDAVDFEYFAPALSGPGVTTPPAGSTAYHFAGSDLDQDGDVDLADAALLQRAQPVAL